MNLKIIPKGKKRSGVGERAPFLITFMILFQCSLGAINTLDMFNYCIPVGTLTANTTTSGISVVGQSVLAVASTTSFSVGGTVTVGSSCLTQDTQTIASIQAGVSITFTQGLGHAHVAGESVSQYTSPFSNLASVIQCSTYTVGSNAATCNPSVGNDISSSPNILVFGDWFRGLTMIYQFFVAALIPGWFLMQVGLPAIWAGLFTAGFYIALLWLVIWMITGRPT